MKAKGIIAATVVVLLAALTVSAAESATPAPGEKGSVLTPAQRDAVKALFQQFETDIKPLVEAARAEVQKLRDLRENKAGEEALKAQREVVKTKVQAIKARFEKLRTDLKAAVPAEAWQEIEKRFHEHMEKFLENHPMLKEWMQEHEQKKAAGAGAPGAAAK